MKLEDMLIDLIGHYAKVGSKSAYIWCGAVEDDFVGEFKDLDKEILSLLDYRIDNLNVYLFDFDKRYDSILRTRANAYKKKEHPSAAKLDEYIQSERLKYATRKAKAEKMLKKYLHMKNTYVPLLKRKVKETYKSWLDDDCTNIIVTGLEIGEFTCFKEFAIKKQNPNCKCVRI